MYKEIRCPRCRSTKTDNWIRLAGGLVVRFCADCGCQFRRQSEKVTGGA